MKYENRGAFRRNREQISLTQTRDVVDVFYKIIYIFLNQQNKEFASKQNFNNLMIEIYFLHTSQEPIRKL
jgi:hypothetical protein